MRSCRVFYVDSCATFPADPAPYWCCRNTEATGSSCSFEDRPDELAAWIDARQPAVQPLACQKVGPSLAPPSVAPAAPSDVSAPAETVAPAASNNVTATIVVPELSRMGSTLAYQDGLQQLLRAEPLGELCVRNNTEGVLELCGQADNELMNSNINVRLTHVLTAGSE